MTNKIALFDMDNTLADFDHQLKADLKKLAAPDEPEADHREVMPPHLINRMKLIKSQKDWWFNLPKIESGFKVLEIAKEIGFRIHILTKGPRNSPQAWTEKFLWCQKYLGSDIDITITQDKGMVYGRVLVDDYPEYMDRWLKHRPRGLGIMPQTDYNKFYDHKNVVKYDGTNLVEIRFKLQEAFDRVH